MASSIKFDNTELVGTTYYPRFVKHESSPDRNVASLAPALEDGEIVVLEQWGKKVIPLQGYLQGSSQADLEAKIDTMHELFARQEKNLDIDWNGATRRYVATCTKLELDRDHFNILFVPWTAEFTVFSGEGKDTSATVPLNAHSVTVTTPGTDTFSMVGSKPAKPIITLAGCSSSGVAMGIEYKDTDTGEKIVVTSTIGHMGMGGTDTVVLDCLLKKVTANFASSVYSIKPFYGVFPKFKIGTNGVKISLGNLVNQQSTDASTSDTTSQSGGANLWGTIQQAQSFMVPYTDGTFQSVVMLLEKQGSPTSTISVRIETDSGNAPSGSLADTNLATSFAASGVAAGRHYFQVNFPNPGTLQANTKYWLRVASNGAGDDGSNCLRWWFDSVGDYANGMAESKNPTWAAALGANFAFRINYGGLDGSLASVQHTVSYYATYL